MKKVIFLLCLATLVISPVFSQESITLTTYYPAPFGVYNEIRSKRISVGDDYFDHSAHPWDTDGNVFANEITQETDLAVEGRVGIGTMAPGGPLHIHSDDYQGYAIIAGVSDEGATYSSLLLSDDNSNYLANSWVFAHKKEAGNAMEDDLHIGHWHHPTLRIDMVIDRPTGNIGIGTGEPTRALDVGRGGGIHIAPSSLPTDALRAGDIAIDSNENDTFKWYDGSVWKSCQSGICKPSVGKFDGRALMYQTALDASGLRCNNGEGARNDDETAQRLCLVGGYQTVVSHTGQRWKSPGDNWTWGWNGSAWYKTNGRDFNDWMTYLTCTNPFNPCN